MKTDENLEQQYDEVIKYINGYLTYVRNIESLLLHMPLRHPGKYLRLLKKFPSLWRQVDLLSGKNSEFNKMVLTEFVPDVEKRSEYYSILVADYSLHSLSTSLEINFPQVNFKKLKDLHELRTRRFSGFDIKGTVGIVLGAATVLLKSIPESVVARVMDYKQFELITFLTACGAIVYALLILLPFWLQSKKATFAKEVLEYTCIRKTEGHPLSLSSTLPARSKI